MSLTIKAYLARTIRHKWLVMRKCAELGLHRQGAIHDLSKFRPDELYPYAAHDFTSKRDDPAFERAVWLHYRRNPHHWNHWIAFKPCRNTWLQTALYACFKNEWAEIEVHNGLISVMAMPDHYALEMLADWWAVGAERQPGNKAALLQWYLANKGKIILEPGTRAFVESHIERVAA